jgi:hypothetical protein
MAIEGSRKATDIIYYDGSMPGKGQIIKGVFNATTAGYGLQLNTGRTWIERGNADDGGKVIGGSGAAYLFGSRRLLITAAQAGNNSWYGGSDRVSITADISGVTAHVAGHWGFLEGKSGATVNVAGAVRGQCDMPANTTIAGVASGFMAASNSLAGTHTGIAAAFHTTNPVAGTWDVFAAFGTSGNDGTGCIDAGGSKSSPGTVSKWVKIDIGGTTHYVPAYTSKSS